ncbi:MAG: flagellar hook-basal body complex protein, partial [Candidatus Puniceispirillaceae bacterium]
MSFYTALTGLNGSSADISATSNNIANVGTTGFKRSVAEFGDIFATSPLQNSSSSIGSGTILKGIKQQFTQGNISSSLNALDLAISGQGFFALKPSLTSAQTVYTRNGSLNVDNDRYVVDSAGQYLLTYPVNDDGSVTAKDLQSAVPLQLPVTSGDPRATSNISLGVNVPAGADVVTERSEFGNGYTFNPSDPNTFTNSTSITIFDDLGNPTIATMYFIKTQAASATDATNKYDTRLVINDTVIDPDLVSAVDDNGSQLFIDRFGAETTDVPDDNYFLEGKGSPLYKLDDQQQLIPSQPAKLRGEQAEFDFGEEGDRLVEIVTDPMQFKATRESGDGDSRVYWGTNFLTVNVDNGDQPVNIDIRPGKYNATQLAAEVERAINEAYGDDSKIQIVQNVDDTLNINLYKLNQDGSSTGLTTPIEVDLLASSFVSEVDNITLSGASPDFTREQFLAHTQARMNESLNRYAVDASDTLANASALGVSTDLFARARGTTMPAIFEQTQVISFDHTTSNATTSAGINTASLSTSEKYLVYSMYANRPSLSVYDDQQQVATSGAGTKSVIYNSNQNTLRIYFANSTAMGGFTANEKVRLGGNFSTASELADSQIINGREFTV